MGRPILAFVVAPLWVPLAFFVWTGVSLEPTPGFGELATIVATLCAYLGMLVVGLPAFGLMRSRVWTSVKAAAGVGALAGLSISYLAFVGLLLARGPGFVSPSALIQALDPALLSISTVLGLLVSTTFWVIARPDKMTAER